MISGFKHLEDEENAKLLKKWKGVMDYTSDDVGECKDRESMMHLLEEVEHRFIGYDNKDIVRAIIPATRRVQKKIPWSRCGYNYNGEIGEGLKFDISPECNPVFSKTFAISDILGNSGVSGSVSMTWEEEIMDKSIPEDCILMSVSSISEREKSYEL